MVDELAHQRAAAGTQRGQDAGQHHHQRAELTLGPTIVDRGEVPMDALSDTCSRSMRPSVGAQFGRRAGRRRAL
jgi:hypothetical protein